MAPVIDPIEAPNQRGGEIGRMTRVKATVDPLRRGWIARLRHRQCAPADPDRRSCDGRKKRRCRVFLIARPFDETRDRVPIHWPGPLNRPSSK